MRIGVIAGTLEVGGAARVVVETIRHLPRHRWSIYTYDQPYWYGVKNHPELAGTEIRHWRLCGKTPRPPYRWLNLENETMFSALRYLTADCRREDLLVAHVPPTTAAALTHRQPCVWYCHCLTRWLHEPGMYREIAEGSRVSRLAPAYHRLFRRMELAAARRMAAICCNSEHTRSKLERHLGIKGARVVYPGIDLARARNEGFGDFVLYPSRLYPHKRAHLAVEAARRLPKVKFRIIGEGPELGRLQAMARGLKNVEILPPVPDIYDQYARCLAVMYFPHDEDFGLVPVEAMACGKPVVAADEGGIRETVLDGRTGYLVKADDLDGIVRRIETLAGDRNLLKRMGAGAREHAQKYSWERFAREFQETIDEAEGNGRHRRLA